MPSIDRQLRANRTVLLVPVIELNEVLTLVGPTGTTCPFDAPTSAVLDGWRQIVGTTPVGASHGGNISGALLDDMTLGLAESDQDTELVITSVGNESEPTFKNVDAGLTVLRDKNKGDTGVYNLATNLLVGVDIGYAAIDRIGYPATAAFAAGQIISGYELMTDYPVDQKEDRGNLKLAQSPKTPGGVLSNYTLAS